MIRKFAPGGYLLPDLPYSYDALEPIISKESLKLHHDILHRKYVENLNATELKMVDAVKTNDYKNIKCLEEALAYNGSGYILHCIYWAIMSPNKTEPSKQFLIEVNRDFGSINNLKKQMSQVAINVEGSGWAILAWNPFAHRLVILRVASHQNLTIWGVIPILVLDSWEHAFYLDYLTDRHKYIDNWWQLVNWNEVERRLNKAKIGKIPLTINDD